MVWADPLACALSPNLVKLTCIFGLSTPGRVQSLSLDSLRFLKCVQAALELNTQASLVLLILAAWFLLLSAIV